MDLCITRVKRRRLHAPLCMSAWSGTRQYDTAFIALGSWVMRPSHGNHQRVFQGCDCNVLQQTTLNPNTEARKAQPPQHRPEALACKDGRPKVNTRRSSYKSINPATRYTFFWRAHGLASSPPSTTVSGGALLLLVRLRKVHVSRNTKHVSESGS